VRVFKTTYRDRNGKVQETSKWYVEFKDHLGTVRRVPAFTDKKLSEELGRKIEKLVGYRSVNEHPSPELGQWIEGLPASIRRKLTDIGVLDRKRLTASQTLIDHLEDYKAGLRAKGTTAKQVDMVASRIRKIFDGCGFRFWSDISAHKVETFLADLRKPTERDGKTIEGISHQTSNFYLTAVKGFCGWMVRHGRASQNPIAFLKGLNVKLDRRHDRRALTLEELQRLFVAAEVGPMVLGVSGHERKVIYMTAAGTGFRANELRTLTPEAFDLEANPPTITIEAGYSKHRRRDVQPIRSDLADVLRGWIEGKTAGQPVFTIPDDPAEMMRRDLQSARDKWIDEVKGEEAKAERERSDFLRYLDSAGLVADFHSLRHTYVSLIIAGGASPRTAMELARHSTPSLTFGRYGHAFLGDLVKSLDNLPDLQGGPERNVSEIRRTGTDDQPVAKNVLAFCLARQREFQRTSTNLDEQRNEGVETNKNPISLSETKDLQGFNGEAGIRTPETVYLPSNGLANRRFQPLSHLSRCLFTGQRSIYQIE